MESLPQLFSKHQTDATRIADVLLIPSIMDMSLYLEMRKLPVRTSITLDRSRR